MYLSIFIPHWGIFAHDAISVCNKIYPIAAALSLDFWIKLTVVCLDFWINVVSLHRNRYA